MMLDWQGALDAVVHHPLFGIGITLGAYQVVLAAYEKTRLIFLQPVLVSMLLVIGVLLLCGIDYSEYRKSTEIMNILLGPATVALAVPLYLNLRRIRQLFWPTFTTLVIGAIFGPALLNRFGVHSPEARGMSLGVTAHAVGTSVALQESDECGAFAALAMSLMGVATAVFLPLAVSLVA